MVWKSSSCRLPTVVGIALFMGLATAGAAFSQDYGFAEDWTYRCMQDWDSKARVCTTELQTLQDDQLFLIYFAHGNEGASPLVVTGDEQPYREAGVEVDGGEPVVTELCEAGYCYFEAEASKKLIAEFRKGRRARIWIAGPGTQKILDQIVSLTGFTNALSGP